MENIFRQQIPGAERSIRVNSRGWFALFTGLNLAFAVCYMMCKPAWNHTLSWTARCGTAFMYLVVVWCVGSLGTWITLPGEAPQQLGPLRQSGLRGWIFLPAIALFLRSDSIWAQLLAVIAAALMAISLNRASAPPDDFPIAPRSLFAAEIRLAPGSSLSFVLSSLVYAAMIAAVADRIVLATAFLAAISFLVVLRLASRRTKSVERLHPTRTIVRKAEPSLLFALAFYLILIALSPTQHPGFAVFGLGGLASHPRAAKEPTDPHPSSLGYRTIVLWPPEKHEKVIIAPPHKIEASSIRAAKPMVIPFFGPYWYFKYPGEVPGSNTRISHGDPLKANVRSTDSYPLLMEAHQHLDDPIDLACCSELQIVFRNDVSAGALAVGISLIDSHLPARLSENLGVKVVPGHAFEAAIDSEATVEETLTFRLPKDGLIQSFDDINVTLMPDPRHRTDGRKVAVERFILIPN